uniref:Uncharacterized protein n=1 Tax=Anguilla anguilla TaxID=7936 RepID=A0A0E9VXX4_ANGAN
MSFSLVILVLILFFQLVDVSFNSRLTTLLAYSACCLLTK